MNPPRVSVIVVSWNARAHLIRCLEHLQRQAPHELIVVDNGSTDGSRELLCEQPELLLLELDNPGFGVANNVAAKRAGGEYLLLLNSDCELDANAIQTMTEELDRDPRVGIVGPLLRFPDGRLQRSMGRAPTLLTETLQKTMLHRLINYYTYSPRSYTSERNADWVTGACMMIRRSLYEELDGFDEQFFMYMEDLDLCDRARAAGFEVRFTPRASAVHQLHGSHADVSTRMLLEREWSGRRYFLKHHGESGMRALRVLSVIEAAARSIVWLPALLTPKCRSQALYRLRAYPHLAWGDLDGYLHKLPATGAQPSARAAHADHARQSPE